MNPCTLSSTGVSTGPMLLAAGGLITLGFITVLLSRRRRTKRPWIVGVLLGLGLLTLVQLGGTNTAQASTCAPSSPVAPITSTSSRTVIGTSGDTTAITTALPSSTSTSPSASALPSSEHTTTPTRPTETSSTPTTPTTPTTTPTTSTAPTSDTTPTTTTEPPAPAVDLTPLIDFNSNTLGPGQSTNVAIYIQDISTSDAAATPVLSFTVPVPPAGTSLSFSPTATTMDVNGTVALDNANWTRTTSLDGTHYVFTLEAGATLGGLSTSVVGLVLSNDTFAAPATEYDLDVAIATGSGGDSNPLNDTNSATFLFTPPPAPDFAPTLTLKPSSFVGNGSGTMTIGLDNVSAVGTNTVPITTLVPKNSGISGATVSGSGWTLDSASDAANYVLTYTGSVAPGASTPAATLSYTWTEPMVGIVGQSGDVILTATVVTGSGGDTDSANNVATSTLSYVPDKYLVVQAQVTEPTRPVIAFHVANASSKSTWTVSSGSMSASIKLSTPVNSYDPGGDPSGQDDGMGTTMISVPSADSSQQENFVGQGDGPTYVLAPGEVAQDPFTTDGEFVSFAFNGTLPPGSYSATVTFNYSLVGDPMPRSDSQVISWTVPVP